MNTWNNLKPIIKEFSRSTLPLSFRKKLVLWLNRQRWLNRNRRNWWSTEILKDLAETDINEYHRFLWTNHLAYAETYEPALRFGADKIKESRKIFFGDLLEVIRKHGIDPSSQIRSIFEVGCSLGYHLRYMETDLFPEAEVLIGNDIDQYAIDVGSEYLQTHKSKVRLLQFDMQDLNDRLKDSLYDITISTGVLMYLQENTAAKVVQAMMDHTQGILAVAGLAHPEKDNSLLEQSVARQRDASFIHNIDKMVENAGGKIISRRWEGGKDIDGNTIYFLFATPQSAAMQTQ